MISSNQLMKSTMIRELTKVNKIIPNRITIRESIQMREIRIKLNISQDKIKINEEKLSILSAK